MKSQQPKIVLGANFRKAFENKATCFVRTEQPKTQSEAICLCALAVTMQSVVAEQVCQAPKVWRVNDNAAWLFATITAAEKVCSIGTACGLRLQNLERWDGELLACFVILSGLTRLFFCLKAAKLR